MWRMISIANDEVGGEILIIANGSGIKARMEGTVVLIMSAGWSSMYATTSRKI